jgi:hypothetical protein
MGQLLRKCGITNLEDDDDDDVEMQSSATAASAPASIPAPVESDMKQAQGLRKWAGRADALTVLVLLKVGRCRIQTHSVKNWDHGPIVTPFPNCSHAHPLLFYNALLVT